MKRPLSIVLLLALLVCIHGMAKAGPYPPAAGQPGSTAIHMNDPAFVAWATSWENYLIGDEVNSTFQTPKKALGPAAGTPFDIVSLGRGGEITLTLDLPIRNDTAWDFAVFENSFSDTFLELAYVEVSSDGQNFIRFDNDSLTPGPVGGFGSVDPTDINGFAGKYRQGYGVPFDLQDLAEKPQILNGTVNLARITHVKIMDITGDGTYFDATGHIIYDPYPTFQSAGFDLDAIGVRYQNTTSENNPPDQPSLLSPENNATDIPLTPSLQTNAFSDPDAGDIHLLTKWQISTQHDFADATIQIEVTTGNHLTSLTVPRLILEGSSDYYWRVQFYDGEAAPSDWSNPFLFTTVSISDDNNPANGIPDSQELDPISQLNVDLNGDFMPDVNQLSDSYKCLNTVVGNGQIAVEVSSGVTIQRVESVDPNDISDTTSKPDSLPLGLIGIKLTVAQGAGVDVTVYLSESAPDNARWYKYDSIRGWYAYSVATFSVDGKSLTLFLQDGSSGDVDGVANGLAVDPGGMGYSSSPSPPPGGEAGFGGGGCFIAAAACALTQKP